MFSNSLRNDEINTIRNYKEGYYDSFIEEIEDNPSFLDNPVIMEMYAECYLYGREVAQNYEKAYEYFSKSAPTNAPAKYYLGRMMLEGVVAHKDVDEGIELIMESAFNGYTPAMHYANYYLFHDNFEDEKTQDRRIEYILNKEILDNINAKQVYYHYQNMVNRSYDRGFSKEEINRVLNIAAALGSDRAIEDIEELINKN